MNFIDHLNNCQTCNDECLCSIGEAMLEEEEKLERMEQEYFYEEMLAIEV